MSRPQLAGLLLAAGGSTRLGEPKQLLCDEYGVPAVARVARMLRAVCDEVFVVVGAHANLVRRALVSEHVQLLTHDGWRAGMGSSIAAGVHAMASHPLFADTTMPSGVLITPCDVPSVTEAHLRQLAGAFDGDRRVASAYHSASGEVRGIPAVLPRRDWSWLATLDGDQGARPLFRDVATLTVALPDGAFDLDTPADVERWRRSASAR